MMKMKNKNWSPKFVALAVVCLLIGIGVGLISYHYFLKPQLAVYEELTQNHTTTNVMKIEPTKEMVDKIVLLENGKNKNFFNRLEKENICITIINTKENRG